MSKREILADSSGGPSSDEECRGFKSHRKCPWMLLAGDEEDESALSLEFLA